MKKFLMKLLKVAVLFILICAFFLLLCVQSAAGAPADPVDKPVAEHIIRALVIAAEGNEMPVNVSLVLSTEQANEKQAISGIYHLAGVDIEAVLALDKPQEPELVSLGVWKITHYCCEPYAHICGTGDGLTATGEPVRPGIVAVDPRVIPYGSIVVIDGVEYLAADCGGSIKGQRIDVAVLTHEQAMRLGVKYAEVFVKNETVH